VETEWILAGATVALLLLVAYHVTNLHKLARWLERGETPDPPRARGKWDELHALIQRHRREWARREGDLATAVRRWEETARALPDGVIILDEGRIAWCNGMAQLHLEVGPARDVGTPLTHLVRIPELIEYLARGEFAKPLQVRAPHDERLLSLRVIPYGGNRSLVLSRDVTQFDALERTRREFVANVSHELRTPLTVVSGFLETLRDETDPEAARRYVALMSEQSGRMLRLVEDLLTLSALESSPPPPMEETVDMSALMARMGAEARALSAGRHRIEIEAEEGLDLVGSEKELASAFGNLVSNAIRYTPKDGTVRLRWRPAGEGADFEVEDTGIGITAEHIPRLTERFYRVDRGRSRETGGTGLGLAIVKHALSRHGAHLNVRSQPGQGSTFSARFTAPRLKATARR
jgi:two-component system phosphate regulon sensor histidine kinase PhoR